MSDGNLYQWAWLKYKYFHNTVETGYTAGIWGHHEHPRYKLTVL
jgi:hypothetical protein